jgi:DNA-binding NarL/FixJ family response regulator
MWSTVGNGLIQVMLVDDHAVVRKGYQMLLELTGGFSVVGEAETGEAAVHHYDRWRPDVVVIDLNLPGISGIEATRQILAIDLNAKVLAFSIHDEPVYVSRAFEAGARGYLCKSGSPQEMVEAIREVARGQLYVGSSLSIAHQKREISLTDPMSFLSSREFEVFQLLGKGNDPREIADVLNLTAKTVSNYLLIIKEKLGCGSTAALIKIAAQFVSASHRVKS